MWDLTIVEGALAGTCDRAVLALPQCHKPLLKHSSGAPYLQLICSFMNTQLDGPMQSLLWLLFPAVNSSMQDWVFYTLAKVIALMQSPLGA